MACAAGEARKLWECNQTSVAGPKANIFRKYFEYGNNYRNSRKCFKSPKILRKFPKFQENSQRHIGT
jgi:hypothetical protein